MLNDFIKIDSLEIYGYHGTFTEEKSIGQKYILNLEMEIDSTFYEIGDDINKTVDYSELIKFIREYFASNRRDLLETISNDLVFEIFKRYEIVKEVNLEILKPATYVSIGFNGMRVFVNRKLHRVYLSLGSNLGDREKNLMMAYKLLEENGIKISKKSKIIETKPYGNVPQDNFLNSVIEIYTLLRPKELMDLLLNIEKQLKRERKIRWGPRTIDLDILLYDNEIIIEDNVIIPHYDIHNREFVLLPLCEVNKFSYNPKLKKFSFEMLDELMIKFKKE